MRSDETTKLPTPSQVYEFNNESICRRTIEQAITDLRGDIIDVRDKNDSTSSLAIRRHQFLLMGAS